jgi:hypothetical protein
VVEKPDTRLDHGLPRAVEVEAEADVGFLGLPEDFGDSRLGHGCGLL